MKSATIRLVVCAFACCLLVATFVGVANAAADPYMIYGDSYFGGGAGAPYYGSLVNGKAWFGQYGYGVQEWGDEVVMGVKPVDKNHPLTLVPAMTAVTNSTDTLPLAAYASAGGFCKAGFELNGYIWGSSAWTGPMGGGRFDVIPSWNSTATPVPVAVDSCAPTAVTPESASVLNGSSPDCAATNGTDEVYFVCSSGSENSSKDIYAYTVGGTPGAPTLTRKWKVSAANRHRAISYYAAGNKIYTADSSTGKIYELDPATGAGLATPIATASANYINQIARYGDKLYAVQEDPGYLHTFILKDGTWRYVIAANGEGNPVLDLHVGKCRGLVLSNDGQYAWVASDSAAGPTIAGVSFWALNPFTTLTDLSDPNNWKNGYPVYTKGVVTALGAAGTGFWIENEKRTTGAWVPYTGTTPKIGDLVEVKGGAGVDAAGVKSITPRDNDAAVDNKGAVTPVAPLLLTNKSILPATDGTGLGNSGLLVTVYGKLSGVALDPVRMYIDDGSGVPTGLVLAEEPDKGVKVVMADGQSLDIDETLYNTLGDFLDSGTPYYVKVTGIVSPEIVGGNVTRQIKARSFSDIVITTP